MGPTAPRLVAAALVWLSMLGFALPACGLYMSVQTPAALPGAGLGFGMPSFPVRLPLDAFVAAKEPVLTAVGGANAPAPSKPLVLVVDKAEYRELHGVAKLLVQSFYERAGLPRVLSELSRLQSNFHYDDERHLMLTARDEESGEIVAYCDVDARVPVGSFNPGPLAAPRPYLSDLGVCKDWRRRGVATALVRVSEEVCMGWGYDCMHLKVDQGNLVARNMYAKLGYDVAEPEGVSLQVPASGIPDTELAHPTLQFASARLLCSKVLS